MNYVLFFDVNFPKVKPFDILEFDPLLSDLHCTLVLCINVEWLCIVNKASVNLEDVENKVILPLYKNKGDVNNPDNYRGIPY